MTQPAALLHRMAHGYWLALVVSLLMLAGCGSTPATHQYTLPEHAVARTLLPAAAPGVSVMPVQLSGHLLVNGIVVQTSPLEVNEARNNLWAEALSNQIDRSLAQALSATLQHARLLPGDSADAPALYAVVSLDQFQGRYDGKAIVSGQYRLMNAERRLVSQRNIAYAVPLAKNGYPALIEALDAGLQQLAGTLARDIDQHAR